MFASSNSISSFFCIHLSGEMGFVAVEKQDSALTKCDILYYSGQCQQSLLEYSRLVMIEGAYTDPI